MWWGELEEQWRMQKKKLVVLQVKRSKNITSGITFDNDKHYHKLPQASGNINCYKKINCSLSSNTGLGQYLKKIFGKTKWIKSKVNSQQRKLFVTFSVHLTSKQLSKTIQCIYSWFNPLSANFTKWSNTLKRFVGKLLTNCLSVFDHFVGLVLKGLKTFCK